MKSLREHTTASRESSWADVVRRAREEHPKLEFSAATFIAYAKERHAVDPAELHAGDLLVAYLCIDADRRAYGVFEGLLDRALRMQRIVTHNEADDIRQQLRVMLLVSPPNGRACIAGYRGTGPLVGWLRTVVRRSSPRTASRDAPYEDDSEEDASPETPEALHEMRDAVLRLRAGFEQSLARLEESERYILRAHYLESTPLEQMAATLGISRATVARRLRQTLDKLFRMLGGSDAMSDRELMAESVSLRRLLACRDDSSIS